MDYNKSSQTRTYKIVAENKLTDGDIDWLRSLKNVSSVEMHKNYLNILTTIMDSMVDVVKSINCKFCNSSKPKLKPLF